MVTTVIQLLENIILCLHRYATPILFFVGNIGNILSFVVFFKRAWKKNVCVFYFLNCLLINCIYVNTTLVGTVLTLGFNIHIEQSSVVICKFFYYLSYLLSVLLPNILILASIDRLLISSQNIETRLYSSKRLAYFLISVSTCFWAFFYIHALIKIDIREIYPSVFACYYDTTGVYFAFISYSTLIIAVGLALVLIILSIYASKNVRLLRAVPPQQRNRPRTMHRKDFQLLFSLYIHDIVYIIFNIFVAIYYVYVAATKDQTMTSLHQAINNLLNGFGIFIHHIPYCASFFIFASVSRAFRQEIKALCSVKRFEDIFQAQARSIGQFVEPNNTELTNRNPVVSTLRI